LAERIEWLQGDEAARLALTEADWSWLVMAEQAHDTKLINPKEKWQGGAVQTLVIGKQTA
jgi:hypothetical protein